MSQTSPVAGLLHPEWIGGRRLWMDSLMRDTIRKLHFGDPVKGWEGDPRLAVYHVPTPDGPVWELWRLEDDDEYRMTCRSKPGVVFDDTIIDVLLEHDRQRQAESLHERIFRHNEKVSHDRSEAAFDYLREEAAPKLHYAMQREHML